jgi:hypothetical protein
MCVLSPSATSSEATSQSRVEQCTTVDKKLHVMKKMTYKFFFPKETPPPKKAKTTSYSSLEGKCQNKGKTPYIIAESPTLVSVIIKINIICKK